jgi:hypothetical protein
MRKNNNLNIIYFINFIKITGNKSKMKKKKVLKYFIKKFRRIKGTNNLKIV